MKSIRRRLMVWLLAGLAILWIAASAGVYHSVGHSLIKSLDAELAMDARIVRFAARGDDGGPRGGRLQARMPAYHEPGSGDFFQMWNEGGTVIERSASLESMSLAFPTKRDSEPHFETSTLEDGRRIRTMSFQVSAGGRGKGKRPGNRDGTGLTITMLAKELGPVQQSLSSLLGGLALVGLMAAGGSVLLVTTSLNRGLKPLRELGSQSETIDASSLSARFEATGAPPELQPIYARLNALLERLEASFERERRFSANLAHEMRTPLAELKVICEVALKWPQKAGPETHQEALEVVCQLESMIERLFLLARLESGHSKIESKPVEIGELINQCWAPFAEVAAGKSIQVAFQPAQSSLVWQTDPDMLQHIFQNLFSNAAEYTPKEGWIEIAILSNGVQVSNSDPGFQIEEVHRLFERYWRANPTQAGPNHAGLGLSLASSCAGALGLRLSANLEKGMLRFRLEN